MQLLKPEILFVSHKYPPATGGMEKQSYELIQGVAKHTKVHLLVYKKGEQNLITFFLGLNRKILQMLKVNPGIQVIHFNDGLIASLALFHKGYEHIKRVVTLHGLDVVFPLRYFQQKIIPQFNRYDLLITVSHATAKEAVYRGISEDKIRIIANGVDHQIADQCEMKLEHLQIKYPILQSKPNYLITLGRPVKRKGFSWLLNQVVRDLPKDFQLLMVGPFNAEPKWTEKLLRLLPRKLYHLFTLFLGYPSDEAQIRQLLKDPEIASKVVHLGKVPFHDLQALLANSTAFLMPNIHVPGDMEGFGLVCLEASLAGTLALASATEGITDAIHDRKNGILLPSADKEAWRTMILQLLEDPTAFNDLKRSYQTYSKAHYSWKLMACNYWDVFQELVKEEQISSVDLQRVSFSKV